MNKISIVFVMLLTSFGWIENGQAQDVVDASTLNNKIMAGYQGWFAADGDGSGVGWRHWGAGSGETPGPGKVTIDYWPDMREYDADELFNTNFSYPDGTNAGLYSAYTPKTVDRHVKWMKDYGIDGVFVQRFISNTSSILELRDQVLQNVRYASETHGRVFANMYDISGGNPGTLVKNVIDDWKHLVDDLKILESPNYLHHKGRPVLSIWGLGHREEFSVEQAAEIIQWLTVDAPEKYLVTLMGGIDNKWQSHSSKWQAIYKKFDIVSPWSVGRYKDNAGADNFRRDYIEPDFLSTQSKNIDYMPVVFPGFSWFNNKPFKDDGVTPNFLNATPRNGGNFFWHQIYNAIDAGATMIYVAMFDEVDEGTAIFKLAETVEQTPTETAFVTLDTDGYDIPSDWYLRLTGEGGKILRGEIPLSSTLPISPNVSDAKVISQNVPTVISPGAKVSVSITLQNTGHTSWTKADGFQLGSQNEQDNINWGLNRVQLNDGELIAPGENKTFIFNITAPTSESVYNFQWRMLQEGVNWFGYLTKNRLINVTKNPTYLDDCDALTNWKSKGTVTQNSEENKQGTNCIEFMGNAVGEYSKIFSKPYNSGLFANNAVLQFWYYVSDALKLGEKNKVELGSAGKAGEDVYSITMSELKTGWNLIILNIKDAEIIGSPDLSSINWFSIENSKTENITTRLDEIQIIDGNANATKYKLKVNNGSGSGEYVSSAPLTIIADEAPNNYRFKEWIVNSGIPNFSDRTAMNATLIMTPGTIEITATYEITMNYLDDCDYITGWQNVSYLSLIDTDCKQGSGCLEFTGGGPGETTREFYKSFSTPFNSGVTEESGVLQFWYYIDDASQIGTSNQIELGSGGKNDVDEYNWKLNGIVQNGWNLLKLNFKNAGKMGNPDLSAINWFRIYDNKNGSVTTRIDAIKIINIADINKYTLLVNNGDGSGIYNSNEQITITANAAPVGMEFDSWLIISGGNIIADVNLASATVTIPATDAVVTATYKDIETSIQTSKEQLINIYPNPSNGQFEIVIPENLRQSKYEIFNNIGSLVKTGYLNSNFSSIDLKDSSKGTYIIKIKTDTTFYVERLIINK